MRLDHSDSEASPLLKSNSSQNRKPRSRWLRSCLMTTAALLAFVFVVIGILISIDIRQPVPRPDRGPVASKSAPGIGFDLTPSYGTAVVRYHNGSTINIAKVSTDAEYQEMMQRFSVGGKHFNNPWATYCGNPWDWSLQKFWKGLRMRLRLPSTPDVARLAKVVANLQHATEQHLGHTFPAAVIATPFLPALCEYDLDEAARLNGILPLTDRKFTGNLHELSAAYVASGLGLCTNYTDIETCNAQEDSLPQFQVLAISYTNTTLFTRRLTMRKAMLGFEFEQTLLVDYEAGSDAIPEGTQEIEAYWDRVRVKILELCLKSYLGTHVDKVLLWGESANIPGFLRVVEDTMHRLQDDMPEILKADPLYIAARGAAELAKRAREDRTKWG